MIKTQGRGELVIISRRSQCHVVWTACGFHLKTVAALKEMHLPRPSQPQPSLQRLIRQETHSTIEMTYYLYHLSKGHVVKMCNEKKNVR